MPGYGLSPWLTISHMVTPKDHTSDAELNVLVYRHSGAYLSVFIPHEARNCLLIQVIFALSSTFKSNSNGIILIFNAPWPHYTQRTLQGTCSSAGHSMQGKHTHHLIGQRPFCSVR